MPSSSVRLAVPPRSRDRGSLVAIVIALLFASVLTTAPQARAQGTVPAVSQPQPNGLNGLRVTWLREHVVPLRTVDPSEDDFSDLDPLRHALAGVRILGLGEATHGTREFFQMKHRLLVWLVREMGFRTLAIEASQAASEAINDYVMGRNADGAAALAAQGFWMWDTEEVRTMLDWLRAHNAVVPEVQRVRFVGVDFQYRHASEAAVLAYLRAAAPQRVAATEALFRRTPEWFPVFLSQDSLAMEGTWRQIAATRAEYLELLGFLTLHQRRLQVGAEREFAEVLRHARLLAQYADWFGEDGPGRDYFMAENLARVLEADSSGAGVVVWAHNYHISAPEDRGTLGEHLRRAYGDRYYALGFSFGEGSFQAYDAAARPHPTLREFTLDPATAGTIDGHLAQVGPERFFLDLRTEAPRPIEAWLSSPQPMRSIGTMFSTDWPESRSVMDTALARDYDGVVFIRRTSRARGN